MAASAWRCDRSDRSRASLRPAISTARSGPAGSVHTTASASIASPPASVTACPPAAIVDPAHDRAEADPGPSSAAIASATAAEPSATREALPPLEFVEAVAAERGVLAQLGQQRGPLGAVARERQRSQLVPPVHRGERVLLAEPVGKAQRVEPGGVGVSSTDRRGRRSRRARRTPAPTRSSSRRSASLIHGASSPTYTPVDESPADLAGIGHVARLDRQAELLDQLAVGGVAGPEHLAAGLDHAPVGQRHRLDAAAGAGRAPRARSRPLPSA